MLSTFPNFKILELSDLADIEEYTKKFPPYNDFDFMSLWTYNTEGKNAVSLLNNNLIIKIQDFITGDFFYSFLGTNNLKETIKILLAKSEEDNLERTLRLVPEVNFQPTSNLQEYFSIKEDPDSFDYILSVNELADLNGSKYHDKRNLVNRFIKSYPEHSVELLDLTKEGTKQNIKDLFSLWEKRKERDRKETQMELTAIEKLFDLVNVLDIIGIGVFFQNKLIGFSTAHNVQDNFAILSFQKCDISYKGIYEYLTNETAKHLKTLGSEYINYEQDLGIPGLKRAKQLWRPVFFLKKITIEEL